jgi:hypothetical protein
MDYACARIKVADVARLGSFINVFSTATLNYHTDYNMFYLRYAPSRLRADANMRGLVRNYGAVCLLRRLWFAYGAIGTGCGVMLAVRGCWNAISTHASISSSIEALLLLSGANY